jgi:alkaline phosphatase
MEAIKALPDYVYVERADQDGGEALLNAAASAVLTGRKLWGLFGVDNYGFERPVAVDSPGNPRVERPSNRDPSLPQAAMAAIDVLAQNEVGFFLMIEQAAIDKHSHNGEFDRVVGCVWELDDTIKALLHYVDRPGDPIDWSNTTIFVTADHETGFLRFTGSPLGIGELSSENAGYSWGTSTHTNQLVTLSAIGAYAHRVASYANAYGGRPILDNTGLFALTLDASER